MTRYTLKPSGRAPVTFEGELAASATEEDDPRVTFGRRYTLEVYRLADTEDHAWAVAVTFHTTYGHEANATDVDMLDDRDGVIDLLENTDPLLHLVGFPDGKQFERKQQRLETSLRGRFREMVSAALGEIMSGDEV